MSTYIPVVVIAGCGISGLMSALSLQHANPLIKPTIFERNASATPKDGIAFFAPNATRPLKDMGLLKPLIEEGVVEEVAARVLRRVSDGKVLRNVPSGNGDILYVIFDSRELHAWLLKRFLANGGVVHFGEGVTGFEEHVDVVHAKTTTGRVVSVDLIIAADGSRSLLRDHIVPKAEARTFLAATTLTKRRISASLMKGDPQLEELSSHQISGPTVWFGQGRSLVSSPLPSRESFFVGFFEDLDVERLPGFDAPWAFEGNAAEVVEKYSDLKSGHCAKMMEVLRKADREAMDEHMFRWIGASLNPLSRWTSDHGRVVLVGDAAHAMMPDSGQDICQCVESGYAIGLFVQHARSSADIKTVTTQFEACRKPRAEKAQHHSLICAKSFKRADILDKAAAAMGLVGGEEKGDPLGGDMSWIHGYSIEEEVHKAMMAFAGSKEGIKRAL